MVTDDDFIINAEPAYASGASGALKKAYKVPFKVPFKETPHNQVNGDRNDRNGVERDVPLQGDAIGKQRSSPLATPDIIEVTSEEEQESKALSNQGSSSRSVLEMLPPLDESSDEEQQHDLEVRDEVRRSSELNLSQTMYRSY